MRPFRRLVAVELIVCLGPLVCEAKQHWIEVRSPHFLVISDAGEEKVRKTATQFERIRIFFRQLLAVASNHPSPFITVLAAKDERAMREVLPEYFRGGHARPAGVFTQTLNQYFAVVELDVQRFGYFVPIYHEYYHSLTMPDFPDLPVWLSEGLADFFGRTEIGDDSVGTGQLDRDYVDLLRETSLIPLNILFKVDRTSPYYNEANKASIFYAESWLLTHYLMIGNQEAHQQLVKYLEALSQGKDSNQAVAAFGDLNKLQSNLKAYIRQDKFLFLKRPPPKIETDELKVRILSEAETDAYLGGFMLALGRPEQAVKTLTKAVLLDPNLSLAYQYLGMAQFLDGQREKALESASHAVALDPGNASARYLRSYYATYGPGILSTEAPVEEDLRQAIALSPEFSPSYALLGLYLALRTSHLEEGLSLVKKALSLDPSSSMYQLTLARVLLQMNRYGEARNAAFRASALARDSVEKSSVLEFNSHLEQGGQETQAPTTPK